MAPQKSPRPEILRSGEFSHLKISLASEPVAAGFPSPAEDYTDKKLDLNEYLIKRPSSTFFVRVRGESMSGAGMTDGDLLVVDRSLPVSDNKIVIAVVNGEFTVKRIRKKAEKIFLVPENPAYKPIDIRDGMEFTIWGVVMFVIHKV